MEKWELQKILTTEKNRMAFQKCTRVPLLDDDFDLKSWDYLHQMRSAITEGAKHILSICEKENRDFNDTEEYAYRYAEAAIDAINQDMAIREKCGTKEPCARNIANPLYRPEGEYLIDGKMTTPNRSAILKKRNYRSIFGDIVSDEGFTCLGELLALDISGRVDPRLQKLQSRTWVEKEGVLGGFTVPTQLYEGIFNTLIEDSVVMSRARIFPIETNSISIPAFANENRATDGLFGGMVPQWLGEASTSTEVTGKLRSVNLSSHKMALYTSLSMEVIMDSQSLEREITRAMMTSINFYADYYLLRGDGVGKPLGLVNDPALIKITRNAANDVKLVDLTSMYSSLYGPWVKNAIWIIAPSVVPKLMAVVDAGNHLVWHPGMSGTIATSVPNTLFGLPVIVSEKLPSLGSEGDVVLADFSNYAVATSHTLILEKTNAAYWSSGLISYRVIMRLDGSGLLAGPLTGLGGDKLSWCVALSTP